MKYYYLVASLAELNFDATAGNSKESIIEIKEQITAELSARDRSAVELLYTYYDILNIIGHVTHSTQPFNQLGNMNAEQVARMVDGAQGDDDPDLLTEVELQLRSTTLPDPLMLVIDRFKGRNTLESDDFEPIDENALQGALYAAFYTICADSKTEYMRSWGAADLAIRNITTAHKARSMQIDASDMIVGQGELRELLLGSSAADFGLRDSFEYMDELLAVLDMPDFVERERRMDTLRWDIAAALSGGDYFGIGCILTYLIHMNILYRWASLDKEQGRKSFREMVEKLTSRDNLKNVESQ